MSETLSGLVDQFNKPIPRADIAALREEISPTGGQFARPPFMGHLAFGIDPVRLGGIIKAADNGSTQEWFILAEEIEELFPHYGAVLSKRRRQVAQLPITIEDADESPAAKQHGDLARAWLKTNALQHAMFHVLDAIGKGFSVHEIIWDTSRPDRIVPGRFCYRPPRFFEVSWADGNTIWLRTENGFEDLVPHKFLVHLHPNKSGNVVRGGLTRAVAFLWMFSSYTMKDWALFVQAYGLPVRLGRYGPEASDTDKRTLWRALSSIAGDVAAMIPKSMEMEFVKGAENAAGTDLYLKRANFLDQQVSKLVLGSTAGTDAIAGGHAVGKEHRAVEEDVERHDASLIGVSLNQQLIPAMIAFTFGPQDAYPTATVGRPDTVPLKDVVEAIDKLGGSGLKVKASQIRELLQLEEPGPNDEVVGGVPAKMLERVDVPAAPDQGTVDIPNNTTADDQPSKHGLFGALLSLHSEGDTEVLDALTARLTQDAAAALHGLTGQVRATFDAATSMRDLVHRLHALKLKPVELGEAMARGMALAELVGQAAVVEELHGRLREARMAALTSDQRGDLADDDFAVPETRQLPIKDATHVKEAWDMVDRTHGLSDGQRASARRRILARAKALGIDTSGWDKPA